MPQKLADILLQNQGELRSRPMGPREYLTSALARVLGDNRDATALAEKLVGAAEYSPLGALTGAYDVGQTVAEAGYAPSLQTMGAAGLTAATMVPMMHPLGRAMRAAAREAPLTAAMGIKAFHGSPHSFERFSSEKIGTGEGRQDQGRGLYFNDNPRVAQLSADYPTHGAGHMYEVDINADPEKFIDYDTASPEMQQALTNPEYVQKLRQAGVPGVKYSDPMFRKPGEDTTNTNYVVFDDSVINIIRKYGGLGN